jgi:hypothetical protein
MERKMQTFAVLNINRLNPKYSLLWVALLVLVLLTGCSSFATTPDQGKAPDYRNGWSMHGTESVMRRDIEVVNLMFLIDPELRGKQLYQRKKDALGGRDWSQLELSEKYDYGYVAFETLYEHKSDEKLRLRNMVQERIMAASERRCNHFLIEFRKIHADTNFGIGMATTLSAGLGALVPGVQASKNLSGIAGILSGVRGEFNDSYYANLATSVIIRGIEESRAEARQKVREQANMSATKYSMAAAINDAIVFDGLCSVAVGLDKANEALTKLADPGLDAMNRAMLKTSVSNRIARREFDGLDEDLKKLEKAGIDTRWLIPRGRALAGTLGEQGIGVGSYDEISVGDNAQAYVDAQARKAKVRVQDALTSVKSKLSRSLPAAMGTEAKSVSKTALEKLLDGAGLSSMQVEIFEPSGKSYSSTTATTSVAVVSTTQTLALSFLNAIQEDCVSGTATQSAIKRYDDAQKNMNKAKLMEDKAGEQSAQHQLKIADDGLRAISRQFDSYARAAEDELQQWLKDIDELAESQDIKPAISSWRLFAGLLNYKKKLVTPVWKISSVPAGLQCK